jgi:hypothetical protein
MSDDVVPKYPPTLHLDGSGMPSRSPRLEWRSLGGRGVVIEEKVDGTQAAVCMHDDLLTSVQEHGCACCVSTVSSSEARSIPRTC